MYRKNYMLPGLVSVAMLLSSGCKQAPDPVAQAGHETPAAPAIAAPVVGQTVLELVGTDAKVKTQAGTRELDALVANGSKGVLAYGPYQALPAGKYLLTVEGETTTPFALEVVSDQARAFHGRKQISVGETPMASLPFNIAKPVTDLEVRVIVPEGSTTKLTRYKIVYR